MRKQYLLLVCILAIICLGDSAAPPFITKCKSDDSKCIKESTKVAIPKFALGLPEYNVPTVDPLFIKHINASEGNLLFLLDDITVIGLKNCEPKKMERDAAKSKLYISILCSGTLDGQYELKGSVLILPIEGKGAVHVDLNAALVNIIVYLNEKDGEDGKKHWQIKNWSHNFELQDKSKVVFENLFNGNEVLGRAAREVIDSNGNDIIKEIGPKVIKALVSKILKYINNFFKAVPIEELSID